MRGWVDSGWVGADCEGMVKSSTDRLPVFKFRDGGVEEMVSANSEMQERTEIGRWIILMGRRWVGRGEEVSEGPWRAARWMEGLEDLRSSRKGGVDWQMWETVRSLYFFAAALCFVTRTRRLMFIYLMRSYFKPQDSIVLLTRQVQSTCLDRVFECGTIYLYATAVSTLAYDSLSSCEPSLALDGLWVLSNSL